MVAARLVFGSFLVLAWAAPAAAQGCGLSGAPAWNESVRYVLPGCAAEFPSPGKRLLLRFAPDRAMSVDGVPVRLSGPRIEPPGMVSWSPRSDAFFVNDGEGSGMSSTFRLFRVKGAAASEDKAVAKAAVSLYRRRKHCISSSADPNVWGFGWGGGGSKIYLLVQSTVHEPCGSPDQFISLVVRAADGKVLETLSYAQTKARFGPELPSSLFGK
jgi:hypothetical protein